MLTLYQLQGGAFQVTRIKPKYKISVLALTLDYRLLYSRKWTPIELQAQREGWNMSSVHCNLQASIENQSVFLSICILYVFECFHILLIFVIIIEIFIIDKSYLWMFPNKLKTNLSLNNHIWWIFILMYSLFNNNLNRSPIGSKKHLA